MMGHSMSGAENSQALSDKTSVLPRGVSPDVDAQSAGDVTIGCIETIVNNVLVIKDSQFKKLLSCWLLISSQDDDHLWPFGTLQACCPSILK